MLGKHQLLKAPTDTRLQREETSAAVPLRLYVIDWRWPLRAQMHKQAVILPLLHKLVAPYRRRCPEFSRKWLKTPHDRHRVKINPFLSALLDTTIGFPGAHSFPSTLLRRMPPNETLLVEKANMFHACSILREVDLPHDRRSSCQEHRGKEGVSFIPL